MDPSDSIAVVLSYLVQVAPASGKVVLPLPCQVKCEQQIFRGYHQKWLSLDLTLYDILNQRVVMFDWKLTF